MYQTIIALVVSVVLQAKDPTRPILRRIDPQTYEITNRALKVAEVHLYCGMDYEMVSILVPAGSKLTVKLSGNAETVTCVLDSYRILE